MRTKPETAPDGMAVGIAVHARPKATKAPRVIFVDVLRLIASIQMINGHTLDAVMVDSLRSGRFFAAYDFGRSLVSVSFLLVAGVAFHLSTLARFEQHKAGWHGSRRRLKRALFIILVGYALSFPFGAFNADPEIRAQAWYYFLRIGVLQCIGFGLLALEVLTILARKPSHVVIACALLVPAVFFLSPFAEATIEDDKTHALLNWISHGGGSLFPIFPWTGFMFAGVVVAAYALPQAGRTPFRTTVFRLLQICAASAAVWLLLRGGGFPYADPILSFKKLASVAAVITVLAVITRPIKHLPRLLAILSSETLTIFAFHMLVLFTPHGVASIGRTLHLPAALAVAAAMILLTCTYTIKWHELKTGQWHPFRGRTPARP